MLFESTLRKELARSFGATLVVLITIILTIILIRTLGQASRGAVNPQDVMLLMAYATLGRLPKAASQLTLIKWVAPGKHWPIFPSGSAPATLKLRSAM
jgi:lipopolysaccharide export LptBFGC system permease protein LptF